MTFANILSMRILTVSSWLVLSGLAISGCNQRPLPSQFKNGAGAAGAAAKGMGAQKTATGQGAMMGDAAGASGDSSKSGGMAASGSMTGNVNNARAGAAGGGARPAAAAGGAAPANNPRAVPVCEGKVDEFACDDVTLYHCVNGVYEGRAQGCDTAAQCTAGLTTGQCGECDPGTFECSDISLQRCDDTGAWVLEAECASAKLCKADMGICDTQVCREGDYQCMGDQLQTCNADFSDWIDEGAACEPGLCSPTAQTCLECLPDTPVTCADERSLMQCSPEGMFTQEACGSDTPYCAEGKCVQCNTAADCGESMNQCGTLTCNAGMCAAGDPKPKGTNCSDNGGQMCDYLGSCVVCVTDLDCNDPQKRCFLQSSCVTKNAITATALLDSWSVTVSPGFRARIENNGNRVDGAAGTTLEGSQAIDRTYLLSIGGFSACGFSEIAQDTGSSITLRFSMNPPPGMETQLPTGGCTGTAITLTAEAVGGTP